MRGSLARMVAAADKPASLVLIDELFEAGHDRFLAEVLACTADKKLESLAPKWYADPRPWARAMLVAYVEEGCDRPRHRVLVKALLNLAEQHEDDELMGCFLRAFDRLVRHELRTRQGWDWSSRQHTTFRYLKRVEPPRSRPRETQALWKHGDYRFASPWFSTTTRRYLRRRAYRWFRMLGYRDRERFFAGVMAALARYRDEDFEKSEQLLDAYGLMSLLYHHSDVLVRDSHRLHVASGRTLAELEPAPVHPEAWRGRAEPMLRLLARSECLFIRRFVVRWLEREEAEALRGLDARSLVPLAKSAHGDVRAFAVRLLENASGLGALPIADWLALLALDDPEVLSIVCRLVEAHVDPSRLSLEQCVTLACARSAPVAELGFAWTKARTIADGEALQEVMALARAEAPKVREEAALWLLELVTGSLGTAEHLRDLIDAPHADVRAEALAVMEREARFRDAPGLWLALSESPYPDVLQALVRHLSEREKALPSGRIEHIWATVLLSVHRGNRAKRSALRQIAERIARRPERAETLLPILRVALRSVREAERNAALASVCRAAFENPSLRGAIAEHVPELVLFPEASA